MLENILKPLTSKLNDTVIIWQFWGSIFNFSVQIQLFYIQIILNEFSDTLGAWIMKMLFSILKPVWFL